MLTSEAPGTKTPTQAAVSTSPARPISTAIIRGAGTTTYSTQPAVLEYLKAFARENDLYADIEFDSEVVSSRWDSSRAKWVLQVRSGESVREVVADVAVSAVGQLNQPHIPDIPGIETFTGDAFHSCRWDHSLDLSGKRVGVIGSGASAVQLVPEIAGSAAEVSVFARTMPWLVPTPNLRKAVGDDEQWLLDNLPHYRTWYRATEFLATVEGNLDAVTVDPDYPPTERAVSAVNDQVRALMQQWIDVQTEADPELRAAAAPGGPFGAKRWIADDGTWLSTLRRPNVRLIREPVKEASSSGLRCVGGESHDLDVLVFATGYRAAEFLSPMRIEGRDGRDLRSQWAGDNASAYLGACVPGFPNFFTLYGPNTGIVVHGVSVFFMSECAVRYVVDAIKLLLESGGSSLEIRESVLAAYQRRIDEASSSRAWGFSDGQFLVQEQRRPVNAELAADDLRVLAAHPPGRRGRLHLHPAADGAARQLMGNCNTRTRGCAAMGGGPPVAHPKIRGLCVHDKGNDRTLEARIRAARAREFVGRSAEQTLFRSSLVTDPADPTFTVLWVHGPGGIGKSALLERFAEDAQAVDRPVVRVDGRAIDATSGSFNAAASGAADVRRVVVMVDNFERCDGLEEWLRHDFVPQLPQDAVVVGGEPPLAQVGLAGWARMERAVTGRGPSQPVAGRRRRAIGCPTGTDRIAFADHRFRRWASAGVVAGGESGRGGDIACAELDARARRYPDTALGVGGCGAFGSAPAGHGDLCTRLRHN